MSTTVDVTGKAYKILADSTNRIWNRLSFWTKGSDVEMNSGDTVEEVIGGGLVSDLNTISAITEAGTVPDALAIKSLQSTLQSNFQAGVDSVYNAVKAKGSTPASKSLSDVVSAIGNIKTGLSGTLKLNISLYMDFYEWQGGVGDWHYNNSITSAVTIVFKNGSASSISYSPSAVSASGSYSHISGNATATITGISFVSWTPA